MKYKEIISPSHNYSRWRGLASGLACQLHSLPLTVDGGSLEPMYLQALERQLSVCSLDGAVRLTSFDKHYWNAISICGPRDRKAVLPWAKSIYHACFGPVVKSRFHRGQRFGSFDLGGHFAIVIHAGSVQTGISKEPSYA